MTAAPDARFESQVIVALGSVPWEAALVAALRHPASGMVVARRCLDAADLHAAVKTTGAGRVLITAALPQMDLEVVRSLQDDGVLVIGVVRGSVNQDDPTTAQDRDQLESWGVNDVVPFLVEQPGRTAVELAAVGSGGSRVVVPPSADLAPTPRPARPHIVAATPPHRGHLHVVWGSPGSPGRSTIAITMAVALSELGQRVLLIDADSDAPALAAMLAIVEPGPGLVTALQRASTARLTATELSDLTVPVSATLHLLSGSPAPMPRADLRPAALARILEVARDSADVVIVDLGGSPVPAPSGADHAAWAVLEAMAAADTIHVVGGSDPVSLIRVIQSLESLTDHDVADPVLWLTRVRAGVIHGSPARAIATALHEAGIHVAPILVPDDPAACDRALRDGATLAECAPDSPVRTIITTWVQRHGAFSSMDRQHLPSARARARAI